MTNSPPDNSYVYPLKVGPTGRYLVDQNDKPFFLAADAGWSAIVNLSTADLETYLANRQSLGFTLILVNLIEHYYGLHAPANVAFEYPFNDAPFNPPNEAYFAHADTAIQAMAAHGMTVLLDATYMGVGCNVEGWCTEMEAASDDDLRNWGRYLGNRYKAYDNIVWLIGGDNAPEPVRSRLQAFVAGVREFDTRHIMTAHVAGGTMAIDSWPGESWMVLNNYYSVRKSSYPDALDAYHVSPPMPFFLIEALYENSGPDEQELRAQSYWSVLSGGIGHIYGNCPMWHFGATRGEHYCPDVDFTDWQAQLNSQGAQNIKHFQALFTARHWYTLVPDEAHEAVLGGLGTPGSVDYVTAAYTADGSSIIAYLPSSRTITVNGSKLTGTSMAAWWYNPATGNPTSIGVLSTSGNQTLTPPSPGDWVLVLDSTVFGFPPPGS